MSSKSEVLKIFKALHKARLNRFKGDDEMLTAVRDGINLYFKENKHETDPEKIKELMQQAIAIEEEIRTRIIQSVLNEEGHYEIKITADHCVDDPGLLYRKKGKKPAADRKT